MSTGGTASIPVVCFVCRLSIHREERKRKREGDRVRVLRQCAEAAESEQRREYEPGLCVVNPFGCAEHFERFEDGIDIVTGNVQMERIKGLKRFGGFAAVTVDLCA